MVNFLFSHSNELHESTVESLTHQLLSPVSIVITVITLCAVFFAVRLKSTNRKWTMPFTSFILFALFLGGFEQAPIMSLISISLGITLLLAYVMINLDKPRS